MLSSTVLLGGVGCGYALASYLEDNGGSRKTSSGDFIPYTLVNKEAVSSTCSVFTLNAPASDAAPSIEDGRLMRAITSYQLKQPQLQIARSYTPLPRLDDGKMGQLRFFIRNEQKGEVSGYLHRLPVGAAVELRGPTAELILPEDVKEVLFLAGGTGIAPAMQVASALGQAMDVHILWACRRREDCAGGVNDTTKMKTMSSWDFSGLWSPFGRPSSDISKTASTTHVERNSIVKQLESMKAQAPGRLQLDYFVDEESSFITPVGVGKMVRAPASVNGPSQRILIVSGPEGFMNYWAGPKQWAGGREVQGPLGGVLALLDTQDWTVVKL